MTSTRPRSTTRTRIAPIVCAMPLHRVVNSGSDAVITGDDGSLWESGEARYVNLPDRGWLDQAVAGGFLVDLGESEPPPAVEDGGPLLPVPPETESEGAV